GTDGVDGERATRVTRPGDASRGCRGTGHWPASGERQGYGTGRQRATRAARSLRPLGFRSHVPRPTSHIGRTRTARPPARLRLAWDPEPGTSSQRWLVRSGPQAGGSGRRGRVARRVRAGAAPETANTNEDVPTGTASGAPPAASPARRSGTGAHDG